MSSIGALTAGKSNCPFGTERRALTGFNGLEIKQLEQANQ